MQILELKVEPLNVNRNCSIITEDAQCETETRSGIIVAKK